MIEKLNNPNGVSLDKWLEKHEDTLKNKRYLYAIKSMADINTGISVLKLGEGRGKGRLREYTHHYGRVNPLYPCLGVKIYYIMTTQYKPGVLKKNSKILRLELKLKRFYSDRIKQINRGTERLDITPSELIKKIQELEPNYKDEAPSEKYKGQHKPDEDDEIIITRPTTRSQTKNITTLKPREKRPSYKLIQAAQQ